MEALRGWRGADRQSRARVGSIEYLSLMGGNQVQPLTGSSSSRSISLSSGQLYASGLRSCLRHSVHYHAQLSEPGGQRKPEALVSPLAFGYSLVGLVGHPLGRAKHVEEPCDAGIHQRNLRCNCVSRRIPGIVALRARRPEARCVHSRVGTLNDCDSLLTHHANTNGCCKRVTACVEACGLRSGFQASVTHGYLRLLTPRPI